MAILRSGATGRAPHRSPSLLIVVVAVLLGPAAVLGALPYPAARVVGLASPATILQDVDLVRVAEIPEACAYAVQMAANGSLAYAYAAGGMLYFGWEGSPSPPIQIAGNTVACSVGLDFKPDGSSVVGWIDLRNQWASADGSAAGWDLFIAMQDSGWTEMLLTAATAQRVRAFQLEIDSSGQAHVAYTRFTLAEHPYDEVLYYARSPMFEEILVSDNVQVQAFDFALDTQARGHLAWSYWANLESVWYANETTSWADVRVDSGQSSEWWDDRRNPSIALDGSDQAHVVWEDGRNTNPAGPSIPNRIEIWHASTADGFVNGELVLPDDTTAPLDNRNPELAIDSIGRLHVAWQVLSVFSAPLTYYLYPNLYYANSTNWDLGVRITNKTSVDDSLASYASRPIHVLNGRVTLVYSDARTDVETIWKSTGDWDFAPDATSPIVGPQRDRIISLSMGAILRASNTWDNDRIVSYEWTFVGPETIVASGRSTAVNFSAAGAYDTTLEVRDASGLVALATFLVEVRAEVPAAFWVKEKQLYSVERALGYLELHPWSQTFPLTFFPWTDYYSTHLSSGTTALGPVLLLPEASRESAVLDERGGLHMVGYNWEARQLEYTKSTLAGTSLLGPKLLPLGGLLPQQPHLAYAEGRVWLSWVDLRDGNSEIYLAALDLDGNVVWGPSRVSNHPTYSTNRQLIPSGGRLWVVWEDGRGGAAAYLSLLNLTSLTFELQEVRVGEGRPADAAVLPSGELLFAAVGAYGELYVHRVDDSGMPQAAPVLVSFDDGVSAQQPDFDVDDAGIAHIVWWDQGGTRPFRYARVLPNGTVEPQGGLQLHLQVGTDMPVAAVRVGPDGEPRVAYTDGSASSGATLFFAYRDSIPPVAVILGPSEAQTGVAVTFNATSSTDNNAIASYSWDFGDGTQGSGALVAHVFRTTGTLTASLTVRDEAGNAATTSVEILVRDLTPPLALASASPSRVLEGGLVTLSGAGSTDDVGIVNWTWSFVEGTTVHTLYGMVVAWAFTERGVWNVSLTVRDAAGNVGTDSVEVTVGDMIPPTAQAGPDQTVGQGVPVQFNGSGSWDDVGVVNYTWSFIEAGAQRRLYGVAPLHSFAEAGIYRVILTVRDAAGNSDVDSLEVTVRDTTPPTALALQNQTVQKGTVVQLVGVGSSDNVGVVGYTWDITRDGISVATLTGAIASYQFDRAGSYVITLTVRDAAGNSGTSTMVVTVEGPSLVEQYWWALVIGPGVATIAGALLFLRRRR